MVTLVQGQNVLVGTGPSLTIILPSLSHTLTHTHSSLKCLSLTHSLTQLPTKMYKSKSAKANGITSKQYSSRRYKKRDHGLNRQRELHLNLSDSSRQLAGLVAPSVAPPSPRMAELKAALDALDSDVPMPPVAPGEASSAPCVSSASSFTAAPSQPAAPFTYIPAPSPFSSSASNDGPFSSSAPCVPSVKREVPPPTSSAPPRFQIPDYFYKYAVVPVEEGYQVNPDDENLPRPRTARSVGSVAREIAFRHPVSLFSMCL